MKLICDDINEIYFWVNDAEGKAISPHFDYEDDALQWRQRIEDLLKNEN